jgi:pyruvate,water dikinase
VTTAWQAPGAGRWERDLEHASAPITSYLAATVPAMFLGMADSFRRYGIPLSGFDTAIVGGRLYARARIVGAPNPDRSPRAAQGSPPAFVLRGLFRLHPELRYRSRQARVALDTRQWRADARRWREVDEPRLRSRNLDLARIDPADLDDAALASFIDRCHAAFADGFRMHGSLATVHMLPVGLWLERTAAWTGMQPNRILDILKGTSPGSTGALAGLDRIADAIGATTGATALLTAREINPTVRWQQLQEASEDIGDALGAYLDEDGYRLLTGFDICDQTSGELPGLVLDAVAARLAAGPNRREAGDAPAPLRERVPAEHRTEYDELADDARAVFGIRDDDVWVTTQWPQGILRLALLEAGRRLQARGAIAERDHVVDTAPGEVAGMLHGQSEPSAAELSRRVAERHALAAVEPPTTFGPDTPPPPDSALPPAVATVTRAVMFVSAISRSAPDTSATERTGVADDHDVHGLGVSTGRYRGRARVVLGPADFTRIEAGDVLVARTTSPAYNVLLPLIGAVVTDRGGLLSHAALVAREFGIPAVVGTTDATSRISDGATVIVDADRGLVTWG